MFRCGGCGKESAQYTAHAKHMGQSKDARCIAGHNRLFDEEMPGVFNNPGQQAGPPDDNDNGNGSGSEDEDEDHGEDIPMGGNFFDGEIGDGPFVADPAGGQPEEQEEDEDEDENEGEDGDGDEDDDEEDEDAAAAAANVDYDPGPAWEPPVPPHWQQPQPQPNDADNDEAQHADDVPNPTGRKHIETALRQDVHVVHFASDTAGMPLPNRTTPVFGAYSADVAGNGANFHAPFTSQMDYEIARWAKTRNCGATAFTDLLKIPGVSHLVSESAYTTF